MRYRNVAAPALAAVGLLAFGLATQAQQPVVELEEKSKYSKIRVIREGKVRTLGFVQDSGEVAVESMVDLDQPHDLLVQYTRYMFTSYLFRPKPERVLIVGLGGGAMVHFLKHHDPKVKVDVVEIDPAIIAIADKYFGVRAGGNLAILNQDALDYLKKTETRYDVIYMDAFLKPSDQTDESGVPLRLKTVAFYKEVQKKLTADGLVAFNVHPTQQSQADIQTIREAFPQTYVFRIPAFRGYVVAGSMDRPRAAPAALRAAGEELDRRFRTKYSFQEMAERLAPP
jgi:spermidine synthase